MSKEKNETKVSELNKESRILKFLLESKNKDKEQIKDLYLNKYKLSEKSNSLNIRVIERFLGVYSKYSKAQKTEKVKILKEQLSKVNINYTELINSYKQVKEKSKRSNRISNFKEIKLVI